MTNYTVEVYRSVGARDNNFKPSLSNDPSTATSGWIAFGGAPATRSTDGDILTFSGTSPSKGVYNGATAPNFGVSTTTYPYLVVRLKAVNPGTIDILVNYVDLSQQTFTLTLTTAYTTFSNTMNSGKTINNINFQNQSVAGNILLDHVYVCGKTPLILSGTDLVKGTVTRTSLGADHAELQLNNWNGKYLSGGASPIGFGDHLHIYLPKQGSGTSTQYHAYGGTVEYLQPTAPPHVVELHSRGYGIALLESLVLANFQSQTPQGIFNMILDSHVNPATKNTIAVPTPYQLTRSFVQNIGSSIGLYISSMHPALDVMKEITDVTTAQTTPGVFFVDPAENLHYVPLNASWTTDPYPYQYPTLLAVGTNQIINNFARDVKSVRNRVHFTAVSQTPGLVDAWTEYTNDTDVQNNWDKERKATNTTATLKASPLQNPSAIGNYSVECDLVTSDTSLNACAYFYPKAKNLALDITKMGGPNSPPLFDFYWRVNANNPGVDTAPSTLFFATDASNRFEYRFLAEQSGPTQSSILNAFPAGSPAVSKDYWYHVLVPIGPNGGTLFANPPTLNGIATASFTGGSQFSLTNIGTPDWSNINYIGFYMDFGGVVGGQTNKFYNDGWRILGGRYRIAYDNRTVANGLYPEMREIHFFDPIAKSEDTIKNLAKAELFRLRSAILRGSFHVPIIGDLVPEQQVQVKAPSEGYTNATYLRCSEFKHHFSNRGMITELKVTDDFTNSQPLSIFKLENVLLQMGENAVFNKQLYDLKVFLADPQATPILDGYT